MFEIISNENVHTLANKKPLILYYSENGGCGPSGLFFIIFEDKSVYSYSTFYQKSDKELINKTLEYVPQLQGLIGRNEEHPCEPEKMKGYKLVYLGLGNHALMHRSVYKKKYEHDFGDFITCAEKLSGVRVTNMLSEIHQMLK